MNILILINGRFHFYDLARELKSKNYVVSIISTLPKYYIKNWTGLNTSKITSLLFLEIIKRLFYRFNMNTLNFEVFQKKMFTFFSSYFIGEKVDILIFFAGNGWHSQLINLVRKNKKRRIIAIADEGSAHPELVDKLLNYEYAKLGYKREANKRASLNFETNKQYIFSDYIVVPSSFVKQSLISNGIEKEKIFINPYGVDTSIFKPFNEQKKIKSDSQKIKILYCGLFSVQKGSHLFLDAAKYFSLNNKKIEFLHVGGIDSELRSLVENYDRENFIHYDQVPQNELPHYYNKCDIFILPSIQDGFGMVALQAMACGLALICSTNCCGYDVVNHGVDGFIFEAGNIDELIFYINKLASDEDMLNSFKAKSLLKVRNNFTWHHYGERYQAILKSISVEDV